jgi:hypothetical protein
LAFAPDLAQLPFVVIRHAGNHLIRLHALENAILALCGRNERRPDQTANGNQNEHFRRLFHKASSKWIALNG